MKIRNFFTIILFEVSLRFIICSDYKSLLTTMGLNSVAGNYICVYCKANKKQFTDFELILSNKFEPRRIQDWDSQENTIGIKKKMLIKLNNINDYVVDTLHLKIRISDKIIDASVMIVSNVMKLNINELIETLNTDIEKNNITAKLVMIEQNNIKKIAISNTQNLKK